MRVSVVVPTYRRPELLQRCLDALLAQCDIAASDYEVVVADDGSHGATRRLVRERARGPVRVRYLNTKQRRGPAAARNLGWRAARAPVIAFTDDDCIPDPHWLSAALAGFSEDVVGVWGKVIVPVPDRPTDYEREVSRLEHAQGITANCLYLRRTLERLGGFDERFTTAWREDTDLFFSVIKHDGRVAHVPQAVVVHPVRAAPWGVSLRLQRKSMFNALLYKKHPRLFHERIQRGPPWRYYANTAALLAMAAAGGAMAVAALFVWVATVGSFLADRLRGSSRRPAHVLEMLVTSVLIPPMAVYWRLYGAFKFRVLFF